MAQPSDINPLIPEKTLPNNLPTLPAMQGAQQPLVTPQAADPMPSADPYAEYASTFGTSAQTDPYAEYSSAFGEAPIEIEEGPSEGANAWTTLKAGLARTPKQQEAIFAKAFGPDNVKVSKDKIYFRNAGESKFRSVKPDDLSALGGLFQSLLENSGAALETAGGLAGGLIGTAAGAIAMPGVGAAPGGVSGAYGGGVLTSGLRDTLIDSASGGYVDPSVNPLQDALDAGVEQAAGELGGNVIGAGLKAGASAIGEGAAAARRAIVNSELGKMGAQKLENVFKVLDDAVPNITPASQAEALSGFQDGVKNIGQSLGIKETPKATAKEVQTIAKLQRRILGEQVGLAEEKIAARTKGQKFQPTNTLKEYENKLMSYEGPGKIIMKDGYAFKDLGDGRLGQIGGSSVPGAVKEEVISGSLEKPLGYAESQPLPAFLEELALKNNALRKASETEGGIGFQTVLDEISKFGERGQNRSSEGFENFVALRKAAVKDRQSIMDTALDKTNPEDLKLFNSYSDYTNQIDNVKFLQNGIQTAIKNGKARGFFGNYLNNADPADIRALTETLSVAERDLKLPPGYTIDLMKGEAIRNFYERNIDGDMILNGEKMNEQLIKLANKLGPDIFPPKDLIKYRAEIQKVRDATKLGLRSSDAAETADKLLSLASFKEAGINSLKWLYKKFAKDVDFADYILTKGINKVELTPGQKAEFLDWASKNVQDVEGMEKGYNVMQKISRGVGAAGALRSSSERTSPERPRSLEETLEGR